jgi:hypothetical protein
LLSHHMRFIKTRNVTVLLDQDSKTIEQQIISYLIDMQTNQVITLHLYIRLVAVKNFME